MNGTVRAIPRTRSIAYQIRTQRSPRESCARHEIPADRVSLRRWAFNLFAATAEEVQGGEERQDARGHLGRDAGMLPWHVTLAGPQARRQAPSRH
eukprot:6187394-Pleurochrysis_carterae.AAC.2